MSELRLYLRRDALQEGADCAWALLDEGGNLRGSGARLEALPQARRCRLVLAGDLVLAVKARLPNLPERRLAPLLPAAAESATLLEAENIHVVPMARDADGETTLAVVEAAWLKRIQEKLGQLGLYPDAALPEYLLLPWREGEWSVGWRGAETVARFGLAEGMCLDAGEPPVGLSLALAQRGRPFALKVFQGGDMGAPNLARWREALDVPVEAAGPLDWRTAPWPALPDLLRGKHAPGRGRMDWTRLARPLAWGALALAGIQLGGMVLDWSLLARESAGMRQEMRVLAERALPAHAAVVDPPWQVAEQLQGLRAASGSPAPDALVGLLGQLGQVWPAMGAPRVKSLSYETGALGLVLAEVEAGWLAQLTSSALAKGLVVTVQDDKDKREGLVLSIRRAGKEERHDQ